MFPAPLFLLARNLWPACNLSQKYRKHSPLVKEMVLSWGLNTHGGLRRVGKSLDNLRGEGEAGEGVGGSFVRWGRRGG